MESINGRNGDKSEWLSWQTVEMEIDDQRKREGWDWNFKSPAWKRWAVKECAEQYQPLSCLTMNAEVVM